MKKRIAAALTLMAVLVSALSLQVFAEEPTSIRVKTSSKTMEVGDGFWLEYTISPTDADDDRVKFKTSNYNIADVDGSGWVWAVSPGTATITVETYNDKKATCHVTVLREGEGSSASSTRAPAADTGARSTSSSGSSAEKSVKLTEKLPREELLDMMRGATGSVTVNNYASVSTAALQAATGVSDAKINFNTRSDKKIVGRLTIDPAAAKNLTGDLKTGVYTATGNTRKVQAKFDQFAQKNVVIRCDQGNYYMPVEVAVPVGSLSASNLHFYSYSTSANRYTLLSVENVRKDSNNYLHFTTTTGGYIIVSDGALGK